MTFEIWALVIGVWLIVMVLSGTLLKRLPLSTAMLYLAAGFALGPAAWAVLTLHPLADTVLLERVAEVAVLISLFSVGLKLGLPLSNWHWLLPLRLAFVSMTLTVVLIAAVGGAGTRSAAGRCHPAGRDSRPYRPGVSLGRTGRIVG